VIILAPSGSGKTYFEKKNRDVIDGDDIIARTVGWPTEREWWKGPNNSTIQARNEDEILKYSARHRDMIIVFNGQFSDYGAIDAFVIIDEARHFLNIEDRIRKDPDTSQPADFDTVRKNRDEHASLAKQHKIPVFKDFEAAFSWARRRSKS